LKGKLAAITAIDLPSSSTPPAPGHAAERSGALLRRHWLMTGVVVVGVAARVLAMISYSPALLFPDSWGYIGSAYQNSFVGLPTEHPFGYPILVKLLTLPDRSLTELVAFQHLAATIVGIVIYLTLLRSRLPRWAAAAAAALVLLDGYSITLEQYVMSDTFLTVSVLSAVLVSAWPWLRASPSDAPNPRAQPTQKELLVRALLAGLLIATATLIREVAPVTIPVFVIYMLWGRFGWRPLVAFMLTAIVPLAAYSAVVDHNYGVFDVTATPGWFLYGRVAGFADCSGVKLEAQARKLCESKAQRASHPSAPDWYVWGPSPARRLFNPGQESIAQIAPTNRVLESFDHAIIRHQPLEFIGVTLRDFARFFVPYAPYNNAISATSLPRSPGDESGDPAIQKRDLPGLRLSVRSPAAIARAYRSVVHLPRPILGLLALAGVLGICLRIPARREVFLLVGSALIVLLATAATGGLSLRYLMPIVPLLAIGGSLATAQMLGRWKLLSRWT
jgi:hypothetical protein